VTTLGSRRRAEQYEFAESTVQCETLAEPCVQGVAVESFCTPLPNAETSGSVGLSLRGRRRLLCLTMRVLPWMRSRLDRPESPLDASGVACTGGAWLVAMTSPLCRQGHPRVPWRQEG